MLLGAAKLCRRLQVFCFSQLVIKAVVDSSLRLGRQVDMESLPLRQFFIILDLVFRHGFKAGTLFTRNLNRQRPGWTKIHRSWIISCTATALRYQPWAYTYTVPYLCFRTVPLFQNRFGRTVDKLGKVPQYEIKTDRTTCNATFEDSNQVATNTYRYLQVSFMSGFIA